MANELTFTYHEADRSATIILANDRPFKLSNVSREQAERFFSRLKEEQAAQGARSDPLAFSGLEGLVTRGGVAHD